MYCQMIGSLMYPMNTRPDIFFSMNNLIKFMTIAKHAVRYLKDTLECGIKYYTNQNTNMHGYVDLDW